MDKYEKLANEASEAGVDIIDYDFKSSNLKGLYQDNTIALSKRLKTNAEKKCILAEEMGHYYTTSGNILDQKKTNNRKQEYKARTWAYRKLLHPDDLIRAFSKGCRNRYEISEYLDVTEDFLEQSLNYFKTQYPNGYMKDKYFLMFIPQIRVSVLF